MGLRATPCKVQPFAGFLYEDPPVFDEVLPRMERIMGPAGIMSMVIPFDFTDYYEKEIGQDLQRIWVSFSSFIDPGRLAELKVESNGIEKETAGRKGRTINIDPGYLTPDNAVLATTKNASHRIYLGSGIYGEVTLQYRKKAYRPLPWTYPDYRTEACSEFMNRLRSDLLARRDGDAP